MELMHERAQCNSATLSIHRDAVRVFLKGGTKDCDLLKEKLEQKKLLILRQFPITLCGIKDSAVSSATLWI